MNVRVREPRSNSDWKNYYELRWRILRAPWQAGGCDRDETDHISTHRMVCDLQDRVLAVGRLHRLEDGRGQIRYMAVERGYQRQGLGTLVLEALESAAREDGMESVILNAREGALPFYLHRGYRVIKPSFLLFDEIQHYLMNKSLAEDDR
jgi:GNAT superfamily N-acetyltransferase